MGCFQVAFASVSKRVLQQNFSNENRFDLHENEYAGKTYMYFSYEEFRIKTRYGTKTKGNSEMAY